MIDEIREMIRRITELERRLDNVIIHGVVDQVDYDKGVYRVRDGEFLTPWLPMTEMAGLAKSWQPLEKGQQVRVISPGGEIGEQSWLTPGGYRDQFPAPSNDGKAVVRTIGGKTRITERVDHIELKVGGASVTVREDEIELKVGGKRLVITGDEIVTHGKTRLNNGNRKVHRLGDRDSDGDAAVTGADDVLA